MTEKPGTFTLNNWPLLYPQINTQECVGFITTFTWDSGLAKTYLDIPEYHDKYGPYGRFATTHLAPTYHPCFLKGSEWCCQVPQDISVDKEDFFSTWRIMMLSPWLCKVVFMQLPLYTHSYIYTYTHVCTQLCMWLLYINLYMWLYI